MSLANTNLSLGEFLRQERERRGITIEQVASATKIGVKTLHSLEGDQYTELPAKPFVRGFVTSYCRFIGMDAKEVLNSFGDFIDQRAHDRPNRESGHSGYAFEKREGDQSRTILWMVMGGFVVAGSLAAVFIKKPLGHSHHGTHADKLRAAYGVAPSPIPGASLVAVEPSALPSPFATATVMASAIPTPVVSAVTEATPTPVPSPVPTSPKEEVVAAATPVSTPTASTAPAPATTSDIPADEGPSAEDPLSSGLKLKPSEIKQKVIFKALESAWVRYQCDHRPVMTFVFRTGRTLVLRARETIRFQVSPPKAVTYSFKGSGFKPVLGDSHLVTRQKDATLFFPFEVADSIQEPFGNERALANRSVPQPRPTPSATPSWP
jgi:cytoskeleton protein RodZ